MRSVVRRSSVLMGLLALVSGLVVAQNPVQATVLARVCTGSGRLTLNTVGHPTRTFWHISGSGSCLVPAAPPQPVETVTIDGSALTASTTIGNGFYCGNANVVLAVTAVFRNVVTGSTITEDEHWFLPLTLPGATPFLVRSAKGIEGAGTIFTSAFLKCREGEAPAFNWVQTFSVP